MSYLMPWLLSSSDFSTAFPANENPISQGGIWVRGLEEGLDWTNPLTTGGHAVASSAPTPSRYSDDIAHLKTSYRDFAANQFAEGVVYLAPGYTGNGGGHEIELLLRFSISANDAHGYEIMWGYSGYIAVVRWEGPVGVYTALYDPGAGSMPTPVDGDVLRVELSGHILTAKRNGNVISGFPLDVTASGGATWNDGQPGIGFWPVDGAIPGSYGWKSFRAGDL